MRSARTRLLIGELASARGRWMLLGAAIAAALVGVGTVRGARPLIDHSLWAAGQKKAAEATLILPGGVDAALLEEVRARPEIGEAERRQTAQVRVRARSGDAGGAHGVHGVFGTHGMHEAHGTHGTEWQPVVLFAFGAEKPRLDGFNGAWPPARGAMFVERSSPAVVSGLRGASAEVKLPGGAAQAVAISGTVHDGSVAPSWQEHRGYAYTTLDTLVQLGAADRYEELLVTFEPPRYERREVEAEAMDLARALEEQGHAVREIRVPPLGQHPHGGLLFAVQILLLVFSGLLLILVSVVLATLLSAQLGRKTRELGVLKAIGARSGQIVALYAGLICVLGVAAFAVAAPLARWGARALARWVLAMMNFDLVEPAAGAPSGSRMLLVLAIAVPLVISLRPILRAARRPVREALAQYGTSGDFISPRLSRLPISLRNALRRPGRLAYSLSLLAISGALVLAAANVQRGLSLVADKVDRARRFDVEIRLHQPTPLARLEELSALPGVARVEAWSAIPIGLALDAPGPPELEGQPAIPLARTYRDGGHGLAMMLAPPAGSSALAPPLLRGRWLVEGEDDAVVLSQSHPVARAVGVGGRVELVVAGRRTWWRLVGVVEEIAGASAFVTPAAFRRVTGEDGVSLLRISAPSADAAFVAELERALTAAGVAVDYVMPTPQLRAIIDDHVALVTRSIVALASLLALVGFFALGTMTAIGVVERTREIGVLKSLGASSGKLAALFLGEALAIAAASAVLAFALSLPLGELVRAHVALGSLTPQFAISASAALAWLLAALAGSALACWIPARRAARMSVREALAES